MVYYQYYLCGDTSGLPAFYSIEAPTYPGYFIKFTSGVDPAIIGNCYHIGVTVDLPSPPAPLEPIVWASTTYNTYGTCDLCLNIQNPWAWYKLIPCCDPLNPIDFKVDYADSYPMGVYYYQGADIYGLISGQCYTIERQTIEDPSYVAGLPLLPSSTNFAAEVDCNTPLCASACDILCDCTKVRIVSAITPPTLDVAISYIDCEGIEQTYMVPFDNTWGVSVCGGSFDFTPYPNITFITGTSGGCTNTGIDWECPKYYQIVDCTDNTNTICVTNNLATEFANGSILTIAGYPDKCWSIEELLDTCPSPVTVLVTNTDIDCPTCLEKLNVYYELINCLNTDVLVYTNTDLSAYVGTYISLAEYPDDCWYVQISPLAPPSITPVTFVDSFVTCDECTQPYYILEDCNILDPEVSLITGTDLSAYVGQIITIDGCEDICWQVNTTDVTVGAGPVVVNASYTTCELCNAPVPVVPVVHPYKSIRPGYNTPGCSPEKYERYLCNFSEGVYRNMLVQRYGIDPCCAEDDIRWEIKKELIALKAIEDPDYTCQLITDCGCTTAAAGLTPCTPPTN